MLNFREIGWKGVVWIQLAQDRHQLWVVVNTVLIYKWRGIS